MEAFLEKIAKHIVQKYRDEIGNLCIVLPNRRAGLFLKKHLSKQIDKPIWMPSIFSIEDFVKDLSGYQILDSVDLLFEFYQVYLQTTKVDVQAFEEFSKWAPILLNDFNEIDSYLVDGKSLFSNLRDIKDIENWSLANEELTEFQKKYLQWWDTLGIHYQAFTKRLLSKKLASQGMAYRAVAKRIYEEELPNWNKIIFAGFNALNTAEERIIHALLKKNRAEILWDSDTYYTKDIKQEAGKFIRKYTHTLSNPSSKGISWEENILSTDSKNISIIGAAKNIMQAKTAASILAGLESSEIGRTAVVLADEKLLGGVLNSLPDNIDTVNITMGLSLSKTPIFDFFDLIFSLHENAKGGTLFYHKDLIKLAKHPYSHYLFSSYLLRDITQYIKDKNKIYLSVKSLDALSKYTDQSGMTLFKSVLEEWKTPKNAFDCVISLLDQLNMVMEMPEKNKVSLDREYVNAYFKIITRVQSLTQTYNCIETIKSLHQLMNQLVRSTSLPFYGEPLQGLQMMGMLETRTLDFENIILLSTNENILPENKTKNSFIPFDLKKAFGLPTYNDRDAIYAYHFYRLIQRAKNIYIIYNTENDGLGKGEKSRFVTQLLYELPQVNTNVKIEERIVNSEILSDSTSKGIRIEKTKSILDKIAQKAQKGFSPSLLNTYKSCSLQFYFQYVARLREADEVDEVIGADVLGNVIHKVLEQLYLPFVGKIIIPADVAQMQKMANKRITDAFEEEYSKNDLMYGKNLLTVKIAEKFVKQFLYNEKEYVGKHKITIESLEQEWETVFSLGNKEVKLNGKIDRVDIVNNTVRIIDYKTGVVSDKELKVMDWEELLTNADLNKSFQLLMYAYLYKKQHPNDQRDVHSGIVSFRKLSSGLKNILVHGSDNLTNAVLNSFEEQLKKLVEEIYDIKVPFFQTTDTKRCEYCSFKMICNR